MPMPSGNKVTRNKAPYDRSTGKVKGHKQTYHTSAKNEAREHYYRKTSNFDRMVDESEYHSKVEKKIGLSAKKPKRSDKRKIEEWKESPERYDIVGIDDTPPKGYELEHEIGEPKKRPVPRVYLVKGFAKQDKYTLVSHKFILVDKRKRRKKKASTTEVIEITDDKGKKMYHIAHVNTHRGYRQKGLTPYTLRTAVNFIDVNNGKATIHSVPTLPEHSKIGTSKERRKKGRQFEKDITNFYSSYDMKPTKDNERILSREKHK